MVAGLSRAQALALSNERLAAIGKMAAHVTHEIRNPLSAMGLNVELLEEEIARGEGEQPAEVKNLLAAIQREVQRLEHLSEEYLRVARLPQPRMEADDVAAAVREIVDFARPEIDAGAVHGRALRRGRPPSRPLRRSAAAASAAQPPAQRPGGDADGGPIEVRVAAEGMSVVVDVDDRGGGHPRGHPRARLRPVLLDQGRRHRAGPRDHAPHRRVPWRKRDVRAPRGRRDAFPHRPAHRAGEERPSRHWRCRDRRVQALSGSKSAACRGRVVIRKGIHFARASCRARVTTASATSGG